MAEAGFWIVLALLAMAALALGLLWRRLTDERQARALAEARAGVAARAEAAERERAAFYQEILDALQTPVWRRADDLTLLFANAAYAQAVDAESVTAALLDRRELGGDAARALARRAKRTGAAQSESLSAIIAEDRRLIEATERPHPNGGLVGDGRDVTALAAAQDEQAALIEAHAEVLERVGTAIVVFNAGRRVAFYNSAFAELFKFDVERLPDMPLAEMLEDLRARRMLPEVVDFASFKAQRAAEFQSLLDARAEHVFLPDGRTLKETAAPHPQGGLIYVYDDVSDRLALERSYSTLDRVQRQTLDALQEGIAVFGEDGRLRLSNPAFDAIFRQDEGLGRDPHVAALADAARPMLTNRTWQATRDGLVDGVTGRQRVSVRAKVRDERVLQIQTAPLADGGALVATYDVTDSHNVETALRERANALEAMDQLKSDFLGVISYELRTPLTTILGFAEMLQAEVAGPLEDRQKEYLEDILTAANAFIDMVDDIIDVAAIDSGKASLDRARTPAAEAIGIAASDAAQRIDPLPLNIAPSAEAGLVFDADPNRLRQILARLLMVAGRYARDGSTVKIEAKRDGDWAAVTVAVGDPNSAGQRASSDAKLTAGASIDLTLAARLAQAHGGDLIVERAGPGVLAARCRLPRVIDAA